MVRVILAAAALLVAGEGRGEVRAFNLFAESDLVDFQATQIAAGDAVTLYVNGFLFGLAGSFAEDSAHVVGALGPRGGDGHPDDGLHMWIDIPLRSDVYWRVIAEDRIGVLRGTDTEGFTGIPNDNPGTVDLQELNAVRNHFGVVKHLSWGEARPADVNYDDRVDLSDLNTVRNNFGLTGYWEWIAPDGPFCQQNNWQECRPLRPTPEPSTAAMLIIAASAVSTRRGRQRVRRHPQ